MCLSIAPAITIEFEAENVMAIEDDSSVTVNLVRTGNHSENITVYISVVGVMNPAIAKCMFVYMIHLRI